MERFNFDVIFEGDLDSQIRKLAAFIGGWKGLKRRAQERYTDSVLNGENSTHFFKQIVDLDEANQKLLDDSRTKIAYEYAEVQANKARAEGFVKLVADALSR